MTEERGEIKIVGGDGISRFSGYNTANAIHIFRLGKLLIES